MARRITHLEYIQLIRTWNHSESLITFTNKGCVTLRCNGELVKTRNELNSLEGNDGNYFEVKFVPWETLNLRKDEVGIHLP